MVPQLAGKGQVTSFVTTFVNLFCYFSKVLSIVTFHMKHTRTVTFENVCAERGQGAEASTSQTNNKSIIPQSQHQPAPAAAGPRARSGQGGWGDDPRSSAGRCVVEGRGVVEGRAVVEGRGVVEKEAEEALDLLTMRDARHKKAKSQESH